MATAIVLIVIGGILLLPIVTVMLLATLACLYDMAENPYGSPAVPLVILGLTMIGAFLLTTGLILITH